LAAATTMLCLVVNHQVAAICSWRVLAPHNQSELPYSKIETPFNETFFTSLPGNNAIAAFNVDNTLQQG